MRPLRAAIFFVSLIMTASQTYSSRQRNDLTTSEKFLNDVQTVAHDLQDSMMLKKKAAIDAVTAIVRGKFGILKDVTDDKTSKIAMEDKVATSEAIRAAKLAFLKTCASSIVSLIEQLPGDVLSDLMELPFFDFVADTLLLFLNEKDATESFVEAEDTDKYNFVPVSKAEDSGVEETVGASVDDDLLTKYTSPVYRIRSLLKTPSSSSYRS